ncbi:molybdenum cofactor synthesis domain protein [Synechococcus sp. PCC 7502]|uniref:molybdopterin molybdotransferase MoeA n=1 Tax=Synechococcus sp. PCC 7502 TaxID=1173263 RepID=UPI00029FE0A9|nr:gephyrin-like molybdotransferase Glp [Synechococcus sp. PCC 7502]AFY74488.1 molybdenum cofactor synthesis domain protein [Synechococcus sp. PCC 7502]
MIPVKAAESLILDLVQPLNIYGNTYEQVDLNHALGRFLAKDIYSDSDFPRWHNAAMDGYAFRYADLERFETLAIASLEMPAGSTQVSSIHAGECVRIFTGGMLPQGADTVVMQEDVEVIGDRPKCIKLRNIPQIAEYVRHKGEFYQAGTRLLSAGIKINPPEIGILAATQTLTVPVCSQPRVSVISTGTELQNISASLDMGQIVDSNQYALSSLITQSGAVPIPLGIVGDHPKDLEIIIAKALASSDMVISSGGVSVGDYDYVDRVLLEMGADIHIRSCGIKPGKPLTVASFNGCNQKLYFGVPGNPASAMVGFWRFIKGAIAKLGGANSKYWYPKYTQAICLSDLHAQGRRETYLWGYLQWQPQVWEFKPVDNYSSGNLMNWAGVNALAILKVNQTYVPKGEPVLVMMLEL